MGLTTWAEKEALYVAEPPLPCNVTPPGSFGIAPMEKLL